ncbi:MAG: hypothetical protein QW360_03425 [Thermofilum sp.]
MINITLPPEQLRIVMSSLLYELHNRRMETWAEWFKALDTYHAIWHQANPEIQDELERFIREF